MEQSPARYSPDGYWMWNGTQWIPNPYRPVAPMPAMAAAYQPAGFRASVTSILLLANVVGVILLTVFNVTNDLVSSPNDNQAILIGVLALLAVVVWLGTFIASIVFFCMWLHRVVANMPALGAPDPRWSPARSVVYCFIPIVNWFHPLWSTLDAWRGADSSRRWIDRGSRRTIRPPGLFVAWWVTWLVGNYSFNISGRLSGAGAVAFDVVGGLALCAAAGLCILVIRDVTARQERKNQLIAGGQLV